MKKNILYILLLTVATLVALWVLPAITKKATYTPDDYPFVYYSSVLKKLCFVEFHNKKAPLHDISGKAYSETEFDSLMPLLNYRQLAIDGKLPDSIHGHPISIDEIKQKNILFRFYPNEMSSPELGLYIMFESINRRIGVELPDDIFRMDRAIEFIDIASNSVNIEKSSKFSAALAKAGYCFPSRWVSGNINPRKPYDEGYFALDATGELFHIKMLRGQPFVRNTVLGKKNQIAHFSMLETLDRRFYGFLFDKDGYVYILKSHSDIYELQKIEIGPLDLKNDKMMIMGNMLYWTVTVTKGDRQVYTALDTETLKSVESYTVMRERGLWDNVSQLLFPIYITLNNNSDYVIPKIVFTGFYGFLFNILLALISLSILFVRKRHSKKLRLFFPIYIIFTGIAGCFALLITPISLIFNNYKH